MPRNPKSRRASRLENVRHSKLPKNRRGLTLIELLVVVGIIALLIGLTVLAVQWSRERSRAVACQNNLKQLGVALIGYHSQYGYLPKDGKNGFGYGAFILPQLEQNALFEKLQPQSKPLVNEADAKTRGGDTQLEVFACPSFDGPGGVGSSGLGHSNYLASAEIFSKSTQLPNIRDGLSNTIVLGETTRDHTWVTPRTGSARSNFASKHGAGAYFLFCEGSVRFIGDSVDTATFRSLLTPNGGETIL